MNTLKNRCEILAPAGNFDSVAAAVYAGCDAVYLGGKEFNARQSADNFDEQALADTVAFCHARGVKVHQTLNTLAFDDELPRVVSAVESAVRVGVDALIIQDLGIASIVRQICPDMPMHASTQMSVHTLDGVMTLAKLGFSRVVLSRECSFEIIKGICAHSPIEVEAFVHGALCMSVSGQCYLSSMIGGRSGNRGRCAQPCRLPFCANNGTVDPSRSDLSLKDLSLINHLNDLANIGVASLKIEGRMKRPEYVACAVACCYQMRETGHIDPDLSDKLRAVFSRSGFTDGYYHDLPSPEMFGMRKKDDVLMASSDVFASLHELYKNEMPRVGVSFAFNANTDQPICLTVTDQDGNVAAALGDAPSLAQNRAATKESVQSSLAKTGGTPYRLDQCEIKLDNGLFLAASALNQLRRMALDRLTELRSAVPERKIYPLPLSHHRRTLFSSCKLRAFFLSIDQIPDRIEDLERIYLPVDVLCANLTHPVLKQNYEKIVISMPRSNFEGKPRLEDHLKQLKAAGFDQVLAHNLSDIHRANRLGYSQIEGGYSLNVVNSRSLGVLKDLGVCEATLSFETPIECVRSLSAPMPYGVIGYGYLPMMLTRNCPLKNVTSCGTCKKKGYHLTDRLGNNFSVICSYGASEILNTKPLYLADRKDEFSSCSFMTLFFTTESKQQCAEIIRRYRTKLPADFEYTRGLYYRRIQ